MILKNIKKVILFLLSLFLLFNFSFASFDKLDAYIENLSLEEVQEMKQKLEPIKDSNEVIWYSLNKVNDILNSYEKTHIFLKKALKEAVERKIIDEKEREYYEKTTKIYYNFNKDWAVRGSNDITHDLLTFSYDKTLFRLLPEQEIERYIQQIVFHELAHKIAFSRDEKFKKEFEDICWKWEKNICKPKDFVSEYAMSDKDEDYAETFAFVKADYWEWREKKLFNLSSKLQEKIKYFSKF